MNDTPEHDGPEHAFPSREAMHANIDALLVRRQRGDLSAMREVWDQIYSEVRALAKRHLRCEGPRRPIDTTVLVHELYLKTSKPGQVPFENRAHLFGSLARMLGQIIIDAARRAQVERKAGTPGVGGDGIALDVAELCMSPDQPLDASARVVRELDRLGEQRPRCADVAWLRFVCGLTIEETAAGLGVSRRTVIDDWSFAQAWLVKALRDSE